MAAQIISVPIYKKDQEVLRDFPKHQDLHSLIHYYSGFKTDLYNYRDTQYFGKLYIGSHKAELEFIFDTGSPWFCVPTTECKACPSAKYDTKLSSTFKTI